MKYTNLIFCYLCYGWYIIFILLLIYLYFKFFRPYRSNFKDEFYTSLPSNISPFELSDLMYNRATSHALAGEVIKLFNEGVLKIVVDNDKEYIQVDRIDTRTFTTGQDYTVKLLINIIGDGNRVAIDDINSYCDRKKNCDIFFMEYNIWKRIMRKESKQHMFYEQKEKYSLVKFIATLGFALFLANFIGKFYFFGGYYTLFPALFILYYFTKIYKRTREANEEYHKWNAFKRYLEDISLFDIPIKDPNTYVMYGVCLGVKGLESKLLKHDYYDKISDALNKCVIKSILNGNRKII